MKLILEDTTDITVATIKKDTEEGFQTYYLSKENNEDVLEKAVEALKKADKSAHLKKIKHSIDENDYLYSLRVI